MTVSDDVAEVVESFDEIGGGGGSEEKGEGIGGAENADEASDKLEVVLI